MNVLLIASKMPFQLVQLSNVFMVLCEIFLKISICATLIAFIIQIRQCGLKVKELAKQISSQLEKYHDINEQMRRITKFCQEFRLTALETSPPMLQTLCLTALNRDANKFLFSMEDLIGIPDEEQKCETPRFSFHRVTMAHRHGQTQSLNEAFKSHQCNETEAKDILKSSQKNGEQCQEEILKNWYENAQLQETLNMRASEDGGWNESIKEVKEQETNFEHSSIQREQVINDQEDQLKSLSETPLKIYEPAVSREVYKDAVSLDFDENCSSENGGLHYQTKVDLTKLSDCVSSNASLNRLEKEQQKMFKDFRKENYINKEPTGQNKHLENEQGPLQQDNEQLENKIEKLQYTLQILPQVHQLHLLQLHRESIQQESVHLGMEKKITKVNENIHFLQQQADTYRKMVEELEKKMETTASYHQRWINYHERNAQISCLAALATERKLSELRHEKDQNWLKLQEREHKIQLSPRGPLAPTVPHAAQQGWRGSGQALHHQVPSGGGGESSEGSEVQGDARA